MSIVFFIFPLPPTPLRGPLPPMGENFTLNPAQRFCPRGEVSAPADEGGMNLYSYLKLSIGFNFAALIAGITPDARPTTTATDIDTTTGQILNGTL